MWFSDLAAVIRVESVQTLWQYIRGRMDNGSPEGLFKAKTGMGGGGVSFKEVGQADILIKKKKRQKKNDLM